MKKKYWKGSESSLRRILPWMMHKKSATTYSLCYKTERRSVVIRMTVYDESQMSDAVNDAAGRARWRALSCALRKGLKYAIECYGWYRDPENPDKVWSIEDTEEFRDKFNIPDGPVIGGGD